MFHFLSINVFALIFISMTSQASVPTDWIQSPKFDLTQTLDIPMGPLSFDSGFLHRNMAKELLGFYELTGDMLSQLPEPKRGDNQGQPWYLQSMGAGVGLEASGVMGLVGLGGEAYMEMVWVRTKESVKQLQNKYYGQLEPQQPLQLETDINNGNVTLQTDLNEAELDSKVDEIMGVLLQTRKFTSPAKLRQQLLGKIQSINSWVKNLELVLPETVWRPYKFQTQIKLSAQGMVQPGLEVGGMVTMKLEWTLRPSPQKTMALTGVGRRNFDFLEGLSGDFLRLQPLMAKDAFYQLQNVKTGIGVGIEGDIGIAEGEAEVFGNLFWKSTPREINPTPNLQASKTMSIISRDGAKKVLRSQWHKGLRKAADISNLILGTATDFEKQQMQRYAENHKLRQFEMKFIEVEFEVSVTGSLFLPTISKKGGVDLYFVKQDPQQKSLPKATFTQNTTSLSLQNRDALAPMLRATDQSPQSDLEWYYSRFAITYAPFVEMDLKALEFKIQPYMELRFDRKVQKP